MKTPVMAALLAVLLAPGLHADEDTSARALLQTALDRVYKPEGLKELTFRFGSPPELVEAGRLPKAAAFRARWEPDARKITKPAVSVANVAEQRKAASQQQGAQLAMTPILPWIVAHPASPYMKFLIAPGYKLARRAGSDPPQLLVTPPDTETKVKAMVLVLSKTAGGLELSEILTSYKATEGVGRTSFTWREQGGKLLLTRFAQNNMAITYTWQEVRKRWVVNKAEMVATSAERKQSVTTTYTEIELELYGDED